MSSTLRSSVACALALSLGIAAQACSSTASGPILPGGGGALSIACPYAPPSGPGCATSNQNYSGFDGVHKYRVPLGVKGGGSDLKITASPASAVQFEATQLIDPMGDTATYFFVVTKAAGEVTITATSQGKSASTKLSIAAYPAASYAVGENRYTNGEGGDPPCLICHGEQGGIDHSPTRLSSVSDAQSLTAILTGQEPSGDPVPTPKHSWAVTEAEKSGLLTYLRAIPPKGFTNAK